MTFSKEGIIKNIGSYILLSTILISIVLNFIFYLKGYKNLYNQINDLKNNKKENSPNKNNNSEINKINDKSNNALDLKNTNKNNNKKLKQKRKRSKSLIIETNKNSPPIKKNENNIINQSTKKKIRKKIKLKRKKELKYDDYELNELPFSESLKVDNRTFFKVYLSLLKTNHLLLFTFYNSNDYNSKIIKIYLFFFFFDSYIVINALFFNDNTLHKIYLEKGEYNFIYQLPQIIYSSLISFILNSIIKFLSLTEKDIIEFKNKSSDKEEKEKERNNLWKRLKFKFVLFFMISYLFLLFFWYYISCFCAVYKNTQIQLLKDTLISWALSLIYPIILFLIPTALRILSLKQKKECIYKLSKFLQSII